MKGYGRSEDRDGNFKWGHISDQIIKLMTSLNVEKFFLVGHDWGIIIGGLVAVNHQDKLLGFARIGGSLKFTDVEGVYDVSPYIKKFQDKEALRSDIADGQSIFYYGKENYLDHLKKEDKDYILHEFARANLADSISGYFRRENLDFNSSVNLVADNVGF